MQRVRMSLPYYKESGWEVEIICVDDQYNNGLHDELLLDTVPKDIIIHKVKAWPLSFTSKFGLGSLSMRSYYYFRKKGTELLQKKKFDLIFFSTTMFHVCALGRYWKRKFKIPFIIDLQDPWRNDFYLDKPKAERPPKFRLAYTIHKYLEAYTMPYADGLMAVSPGYIQTIKSRYPTIKAIPDAVISFGCSESDFKLVKEKNIPPEVISFSKQKIKVVYTGAITRYFLPLLKAFFIVFKECIKAKQDYHFYFIGTSYSKDSEIHLVKDLADQLGIGELVTESPQRIPYFSAISTMLHADILFIPGSMDVDYNASKVYNCILASKPVFSIFNNRSLVKDIIERSNAGIVVSVDGKETEEELINQIRNKIMLFESLHLRQTAINMDVLKEYTAKSKTLEQTRLFDQVLLEKGKKKKV